jgi:hypothetical protein
MGVAVMACWSVCTLKEYSTKSGRRTNHLRTHDLFVLSCKYPLRTHCVSAATCGTHGHPNRMFHCKACSLYSWQWLRLLNTLITLAERKFFSPSTIKNITKTKDNKTVSGFSQHNNILFYFILTTCFGQLTIIGPSLQNLASGNMQCK